MATAFRRAAGFALLAVFALVPSLAIAQQQSKSEKLAAELVALLDARKLARNQDATLAGRVASYLYLGRTFQWDIDLERGINALTPDAVRAAMQRHLKPERLSIVRVGDFSKPNPGRPGGPRVQSSTQ